MNLSWGGTAHPVRDQNREILARRTDPPWWALRDCRAFEERHEGYECFYRGPLPRDGKPWGARRRKGARPAGMSLDWTAETLEQLSEILAAVDATRPYQREQA